jgi:hypothetical protein
MTDVEEGGFYAIEWGDGHHGTAKVLVVDDVCTHVRLYPNEWPVSPVGLSPDELKSKAIRNGRPKIGHVPLSHALFESWKPVILARQKVVPEELDGYRTWLENKGGYFKMLDMTARKLQQMILDVANNPNRPWEDMPASD